MNDQDFDYPKILDLFPEHLDPKRSESASFLIWYLENYYRLDTSEAVDSVVDQHGDKGIDGIYVNDDDSTITILQARVFQSAKKGVGDKPLREFAGTLGQFRDSQSLETLLDSGKAKLAALTTRLDLSNKLNTHEVRGDFLSNAELDSNGKSFMKGSAPISFVGRKRLVSSYISNERSIPPRAPATFDIQGLEVSEYSVDANTKSVIAPIKAVELAALDGIANQSLFAYNVRGPLGNTQVNKDITKSIRDSKTHKLFPLFHNGITVIAGRVEKTDDAITVEDYFVVNGCQSLNALFMNRKSLTTDLRVLTKIIMLDPNSKQAQDITERSNNQNSAKPRDFMSNNRIQIRLQNEILQHYSGQYGFEIKRGENVGHGQVISNEEAGLYLMAFDEKTPWATHRKYQVFQEKHADLFGRQEVTADRIVMCQVIRETVDAVLVDINNRLLAKYVLTRYLLIFIVRNVLESDEFGRQIIAEPKSFVREQDIREKFRKLVEGILQDIVTDLNSEVDEHEDDFDYRGRLRDVNWVKELTKDTVSLREKLVRRGKIKVLRDEWKDQ